MNEVVVLKGKYDFLALWYEYLAWADSEGFITVYGLSYVNPHPTKPVRRVISYDDFVCWMEERDINYSEIEKMPSELKGKIARYSKNNIVQYAMAGSYKSLPAIQILEKLDEGAKNTQPIIINLPDELLKKLDDDI